MATEGLSRRRWLLVPGTLCTGAVFDGLLEALGVERDRRVVLPLERPDVEDYAHVLRSAAGPDVVICGFSLGAIVLAHHADRLEASQMLLFGLNPHADDPAKAEGRRSLAEDVAARGGAAALADRLAPLHGPDPAGARSLILRMAEEAGGHLAAQTQLAIGRPGAMRALRSARAPVAILTGTLDEQTPLALAREAAGALPDGRAIALPGLGHFALAEDPDACARAVLSQGTLCHDG